ncbi:ubiquitin carboxyl-terminal hydrolase 47 isoform X2 [Osmerus eperlanus]|uniref:ubiquitin carboxyl-terminal hydrolase 47 isoform X2 n=1 Tax=Osmerus eperlanus TaxID=29151 RepID=UPI002E1057CF
MSRQTVAHQNTMLHPNYSSTREDFDIGQREVAIREDENLQQTIKEQDQKPATATAHNTVQSNYSESYKLSSTKGNIGLSSTERVQQSSSTGSTSRSGHTNVGAQKNTAKSGGKGSGRESNYAFNHKHPDNFPVSNDNRVSQSVKSRSRENAAQHTMTKGQEEEQMTASHSDSHFFYSHDQQRLNVPVKKEYHGLYNQGSTCYLNSVLQVLFMTEECRKAVLSLNALGQFDNNLKSLFKTLKKETTDTCKITPCLDIGKEFMQRDAAEYFEKILNNVHDDVSKVFNGSLRHTSTCSKNHQTSDEVCSFWTLPLSLEGPSGEPYSVMDGFEDFFKGSPTTKDNMMYCDKCGDKKDGQNRNVQYELYAIVDHSGSLTSGHYRAQIKSYEDQKWYEFDDNYVKQLRVFEDSAFQKSNQAYLLMYKKCGEGLGTSTSQMQEYSHTTTAASKREEKGSGGKKDCHSSSQHDTVHTGNKGQVEKAITTQPPPINSPGQQRLNVEAPKKKLGTSV